MIKLYVGNLPYSYNDTALKQLFSPYGDVTASVIIDRTNGRSKGFGFVEVPSDRAQAAMTEMNGKVVDGRAIVVNEARPMTERPKKDFGRRREHGLEARNRNGRSFRRN